MRLAYLGTPDLAVAPLEALCRAGHEISIVVSNPDRRRGRGGATSPSPVKAAAVRLGLPVTDDLSEVTAAGAELGVVVAYGRIIPTSVLEELPMVNLHFSLLPRWRGAAPVERAILAGDATTGVCVMEVAEGLDTGGVHARAEVPIGPTDTTGSLRGRLVEVGTELLLEALDRGLGAPEPQSDVGVTYAEKLRVEELHLDWRQPAEVLDRVVRVGGAWTTLDGKRLKVHEAVLAEPGPHDEGRPEPGTVEVGLVVACGSGGLRLRRVQPEGRAVMDARDWANGARPVGARLGT